MENNEIISNLSYTNRDFQTVYPELLDLVRKLTDKWDPSISTESDPGVILLKLNALIADKNSYNIDKNILETFPLSVTQEKNAIQVFEALGYRPRWYIAATSYLDMYWDAPEEEEAEESESTESEMPTTPIYYNTRFTIPKFTAFSDSDNTVVYTTTQDVSVYTYADNSVSSNISRVPVIQGILTDYDINGDRVITADYLDDYNRLYFPYDDVAENGIFITNITDSTNLDSNDGWSEWKAVENLYVVEMGDDNEHKFYKFGIDPFTGMPFIEFPENINALIGAGLLIKYIRTDGYSGNVSSNTIDRIYSSQDYATESYVSRAWTSTGETVEASADTLRVYNQDPITNGFDPEDIDSAYRNYTKTIGTFNTLVTLRDYMNYINTFGVQKGVASNSFVTDRTNDIQESYKVVTYGDSGETVETRTMKSSRDSVAPNKVAPFDIKLYMLTYVGNIDGTMADGRYDYETTFNMFDAVVTNSATDETYLSAKVANLLDEAKSIQHNFQSIKSGNGYAGNPTGTPLFIKNKYTVNCTVIPYNSVTQVQADQIESNIKNALYVKLNSKEIDFGKETSYATLQDTILKADNRIQNIVLEYPQYTTYMVYWDESADNGKGRFKEVAISDNYMDAYDQVYVCDADMSRVSSDSFDVLYYKEHGIDPISDTGYVSGTKVLVYGRSLDNNVPSCDWYVYRKEFVTEGNSTSEKWVPYSKQMVVEVPVGDGVTYISCESDISFFRRDTYAKSVLAGNTQLYKDGFGFDIGAFDRFSGVYENVSNITSETKIPIEFESGETESSYTKITDNENVVFLAPNLIDEKTYSTYVKFVAQLNGPGPIPANSDYALCDNETVIFFWKNVDDDDADYTYQVYGKGTIVKPSFTMSTNIPEGYSIASFKNGPSSGTLPASYPSFDVSKIIGTANTLTATKTISIRKVNNIELTSVKNDRGEHKAFWLTNTKTGDKKYSILFPTETVPYNEAERAFMQTRILQDGELFIYTNMNRTAPIQVLGSGTKLERKVPYEATQSEIENDITFSFDALECPSVDYATIDQYGLSQLSEDEIKTITKVPVNIDGEQSAIEFWATEMQIVELGSGTYIKLAKDSQYVIGERLYYEANCDQTTTLDDNGSWYKERLYRLPVTNGYEIDNGTLSIYDSGEIAMNEGANCDLFGNQISNGGSCDVIGYRCNGFAHIHTDGFVCDTPITLHDNTASIFYNLYTRNGQYQVYNSETSVDQFELAVYPQNIRYPIYETISIAPSFQFCDGEGFKWYSYCRFASGSDWEQPEKSDFSDVSDPIDAGVQTAFNSPLSLIQDSGKVRFTSGYTVCSTVQNIISLLKSEHSDINDYVTSLLTDQEYGGYSAGDYIYYYNLTTSESSGSPSSTFILDMDSGILKSNHGAEVFGNILVHINTDVGDFYIVYNKTSPRVDYTLSYKYTNRMGNLTSLSQNNVTASYMTSVDKSAEKMVFTNNGLYRCEKNGVADWEKITDFTPYTIKYVEGNPTGTYTPLEKINIGGTQWETFSRLSLDMSKDYAQYLMDRQELKLYQNGSTSNYTCVAGLSVKSSLPINKLGGEYIDVSSIDASGSTIYPTIYSFEQAADCDAGGWKLSVESQTAVIELKAYGGFRTSVNIPIELSSGSYILPIGFDPGSWESNPQLSVYTCDGEGSEPTLVKRMNQSTTVAGFSESTNRLFFNLEIDSNVEEIVFEIEGTEYNSTTTPTITVYPLLKYVFTDEKNSDKQHFLETVENRLWQIDADYDAYDYSWQVNSETEIVNPLSAISFFDNNHVYNNYTISYIGRSDKQRDYDSDEKSEDVELRMMNRAR